MKAPLSWLKEFVDIQITIPELSHLLTMAGLEVEEIRIIGLPMPPPGSVDAHVTGLEWDPEKIVVASIQEVLPHPNADRLVLCRLQDGQQEQVVLTGAPNLFQYKNQGPLKEPLKVAYAKEGARIYDGHQEGFVLTTLKRAKIRGVESYSMVCSEKELGISDEHEGIILLEGDYPNGMPLSEAIGDAVLDVKLLPSYARCASMLGLAREIAAMTGKPLKQPVYGKIPTGKADYATIEITNPELNPRFVLGLIRDVAIRPSPGWVQHRLKMAGMRPINNIVDATNYAMLEIGEPLHAFDFDVLKKRAGGKTVKISTRTARKGEKLTTLDGVERSLDEFTVLVCDQKGPLSIAGVMGGAESEIHDASPDTPALPEAATAAEGLPHRNDRLESTKNILLEGAAWNYINIRKTARNQMLPSEASYRFSRGVHPAMAERGVRRGLGLMKAWAEGEIAPGLVDQFPLPPKDVVVNISPQDVERVLGIKISKQKIARILQSLEFKVEIQGKEVRATCPDHRMDIGDGISGKADLVEEVARIYGYDQIPETRMADTLPVQRGNSLLDKEERVRDLLVRLGLQEIIGYRFSSPQKESRRLHPESPPDDKPYVQIANPLSPDKAVLRHSLVASLLENAERNARFRDRLAMFEIGPVFIGSENADGLPDELQRMTILVAGPRSLSAWQSWDRASMDFYDLKGMVEGIIKGLHIPDVHYETGTNPSFHPGKCARIISGEKQVGLLGELHPRVRDQYEWPASFKAPVLVADLDLDALLSLMPDQFQVTPVPTLPPVYEDLAIVVGEEIPADRVADLIRQVGGKIVTDVNLFDVYRGENLGAGRKSLAFSLTYQARDKTLSDRDVAGIRSRIINRLKQEIGADLRS